MPNQDATRPTWPKIQAPIWGSTLASQPVAVSRVWRFNEELGVVARLVELIPESGELVVMSGVEELVARFEPASSTLVFSFSRNRLSKAGGWLAQCSSRRCNRSVYAGTRAAS